MGQNGTAAVTTTNTVSTISLKSYIAKSTNRSTNQTLLTLQRGVTSAGRHSENITCGGVTSIARQAALPHSFDYISTT